MAPLSRRQSVQKENVRIFAKECPGDTIAEAGLR
jgi:hypothetical protein